MNGVYIRDDEHFEKALRRFTKICERSGILSEVKKYRHYEKPSAKRKRERNSAEQRAKRDKKDFK